MSSTQVPLSPADTPNRAAEDAIPLPTVAAGAKAPAWWGMVLFITTEATLFAALISSYFYLASGAPVWPPDGIKPPDLLSPIIGTVLLLSSSVPIVAAERSIRRGDRRGLVIGLVIGFALDAFFLVLQSVEYTKLEFSATTNQYGSAFWIITGLHMAHVLFALLMVAFLLLRAARGHFTAERHLAVQNVGMYWHFVGAVWIVVFTSLYVLPHFI